MRNRKCILSEVTRETESACLNFFVCCERRSLHLSWLRRVRPFARAAGTFARSALTRPLNTFGCCRYQSVLGTPPRRLFGSSSYTYVCHAVRTKRVRSVHDDIRGRARKKKTFVRLKVTYDTFFQVLQCHSLYETAGLYINRH